MARKVRKILRSLDAMRVENPCLPGTPDLNFAEGWIELKAVKEWPKRETTPLRVPHFTQQQRVWLTRRHEKGGLALLLLQVADEFLLLSGVDAATLLGNATRDELRTASIETFTHSTLDPGLLECCRRLTSNRTNAS